MVTSLKMNRIPCIVPDPQEMIDSVILFDMILWVLKFKSIIFALGT